MSKAAFDWTDEAVERLKAYVAEGESASRIAALLDPARRLTRSAVCGKAFRLHLVSMNRQMATTGPRLPKPRFIQPRAKPAMKTTMLFKNKAPEARPKPWVSRAAEIAKGAPPSLNLSIFDLKAHDGCRWIEGDPKTGSVVYCGHKGWPWCDFHALVCEPGKYPQQPAAQVAA